MKFQVESTLVGVELEGMLSLAAHCQQTPAPISSHHGNCGTAIYFLQKAAEPIIPAQRSIAVPNHHISVVHNLKSSGLVVQFELMEIASEAYFVLVD